MIRNILFDMGNVLIRFDRQEFLDRLDLSPQDRQLLLREVFLSVEWVQMDRGTLDEPEAEARMCRRLPEHLHHAVHALVSQWDEPMLPMPGMEALVRDLKKAGYGVYLLSNASRRQHTYWPKVPGFDCFDGTLISADEGIMKPSQQIYHLILARFGLNARECFFIDDVPANIEAAQACGLQGAVFHGNAALLRQQLHAAGVALT